MLIRNSAGDSIRCYCVLDSDYHTPDEIALRYAQANDRGVDLTIWPAKEIENYLIVPSVIARVIRAGVPRRTAPPEVDEVTSKIDELAVELKDEVIDNFSTEFWNRDRSRGLKPAMQRARALVEANWTSSDNRVSLVPGKALLSSLSGWAKEEFGVQLSSKAILREMSIDEVHEDVRETLEAIHELERLPGVNARAGRLTAGKS